MAAVVLASAGYLLTREPPRPLRRWRRDRALPLRRNRDFVLYQSGGLLSTFGSGISGIAYPLLTLALTHSAAKTGYVGAVEFLPLVLLSAPAGVAADRFDRRRLMIASDAVGATALALLAAAVLTGHARFWMIVVVAFVDTSAAVLYRSGSSGAMKAVVPSRSSPTPRA